MSKKRPPVQLHKGEKVVLNFQRSTINLWLTWIFAALIICGLLAAWWALDRFSIENAFFDVTVFRTLLQAICLIALPVVVIAALITSYVDRKNRMFVTNQRIIQTTATSLFAYSVNVIELKNVEDVSYRKDDFVAHLFRYGTLRISTEGDETTYVFSFLCTPHDEMETISKLVADAHKSKKTS